MSNKTPTTKPLILAMQEAEQILVNAVNQILASGVTPYFAKMMFDKVYGEVKGLANNELNNAKANWENAIAQAEAEKNKAENAPE